MPLPHYDIAHACQRLPGILLQRGLRVKSIDMAHAAAHKQRDHTLGPRIHLRPLSKHGSQRKTPIATQGIEEQFPARCKLSFHCI